MTQDEIIEMAVEAGFCLDISNGIYLSAPIHLEAFAKIVAQHEREACAKVCEAYQDPFSGNAMADTIRAKGQA